VLRNQTKALINTSLISANESHYFGVNDSSLLKSGKIKKEKKKKKADKHNESSMIMNTVGVKDAYGSIEEIKVSNREPMRPIKNPNKRITNQSFHDSKRSS
jgi:hypothetical protein